MTSPAAEDRVREIISDLFGVPAQEIDETFGPGDCPAWTSLGHLRLVATLEEDFHIQIPMEQVGRMSSFQAVMDALMRLGVAP
jgi:acyl carrier protein